MSFGYKYKCVIFVHVAKSTEGVPIADAVEEESADELSLRSAIERLNIGDGDQQDAVPWQTGQAWGEVPQETAGVIQEKGDMLVAYSTVSGKRAHVFFFMGVCGQAYWHWTQDQKVQG